MAAAIVPFINLGIALAPEIPALVADIKALFAKHNVTDPVQQAAIIQVLMTQAVATNQSTIDLINTDQATHQPPPPIPGS